MKYCVVFAKSSRFKLELSTRKMSSDEKFLRGCCGIFIAQGIKFQVSIFMSAIEKGENGPRGRNRFFPSRLLNGVDHPRAGLEIIQLVVGEINDVGVKGSCPWNKTGWLAFKLHICQTPLLQSGQGSYKQQGTDRGSV